MGGPTPRSALSLGKSVEERLTILELRQWIAPERLAGVLGSVADANEPAGSGWFRTDAGALNNPSPGVVYIIEQYELDSTTRYQLAHRIGSPASQIFTERWARTRTGNGGWTAWRLLSLPTTSFAPVGSGITIGNGTITGQYSVADGMLTGRIVASLGSTSSVSGDLNFEHPPVPYAGSTRSGGLARFIDSSAGTAYPATVLINSSRVYARPMVTTSAAAGTPIWTREANTGASAPFTWAVGDSIVIDFDYPII
ncbi:hypothetical protein SEA_GAZEBO_38 [Microbacterium phage Gazebo]|nr:hypothetical protein SEA_GAZEBO_38 [Microbacterium phage Gazebo]